MACYVYRDKQVITKSIYIWRKSITNLSGTSWVGTFNYIKTAKCKYKTRFSALNKTQTIIQGCVDGLSW